MEVVGDDLSCMLPCPGFIQDLDVGQVVADDPFSRADNLLQFAL